MKGIINFLLLIAVGFGIYGLFKPLPDGINEKFPLYGVPAKNVSFYEDRTYVNGAGNRVSEQEIFDQAFALIDGANNYILMDMFLFNDFLGTETESYRPLAEELTQKLVAKKQDNPDMSIIFITDPINTIYGGYESEYLNRLEDAGVMVVVTDLLPLRDSNPVYSGFYRAYVRWFPNQSMEDGRFANPFDQRLPNIGLRSYLSLLNFKANHRKVMIADGWVNGQMKMRTFITSANPHDGSSAHSNVAVVIDDFVWKDVLKSERATARFSGIDIPEPNPGFIETINDEEGDVGVRILVEKQIKEEIVRTIRLLKSGDTLDMAMFYLSERQIIRELKRASERDADIRLLLDPNKDAFGREKNGIPNRPVAEELLKESNIKIRWCDTHGEQCHSKMLIAHNKDGYHLIAGSANLTRRNVGGFNLETNAYIESPYFEQVFQDASDYFEDMWNNTNRRLYSTEFSTYRDDSYQKWLQYRFMEDLGLSSF